MGLDAGALPGVQLGLLGHADRGYGPVCDEQYVARGLLPPVT